MNLKLNSHACLRKVVVHPFACDLTASMWCSFVYQKQSIVKITSTLWYYNFFLSEKKGKM